MTVHYVDKTNPLGGSYEIIPIADGWAWEWREDIGEGEIEVELGKTRDTKAEAYRDAADDWESNGGGPGRLAGTLRAMASRLEAAES